MKKLIYKVMAMLIFSSVLLSSCSVEYRERHRKVVEDDHHNHDHDHDHNYHNGY